MSDHIVVSIEWEFTLEIDEDEYLDLGVEGWKLDSHEYSAAMTHLHEQLEEDSMPQEMQSYAIIRLRDDKIVWSDKPIPYNHQLKVVGPDYANMVELGYHSMDEQMFGENTLPFIRDVYASVVSMRGVQSFQFSSLSGAFDYVRKNIDRNINTESALMNQA